MLCNPVLWIDRFYPLHINAQMPYLTTVQSVPDRLVVQQATCRVHVLMS